MISASLCHAEANATENDGPHARAVHNRHLRDSTAGGRRGAVLSASRCAPVVSSARRTCRAYLVRRCGQRLASLCCDLADVEEALCSAPRDCASITNAPDELMTWQKRRCSQRLAFWSVVCRVVRVTDRVGTLGFP